MLALAHSIGERASSEQRDRTESALGRVLEAADQARERQPDARLLVAEALEDGEPNLVSNLAGEIRRRMGVESDARMDFVAQVGVEGERGSVEGRVGVIQLDAIGATVAATFANRELQLDAAAVTAATGALLMAMGTADRENFPLALDAPPERVERTEVKPPWEVSHPVLLDPVIWLLATAYTG